MNFPLPETSSEISRGDRRRSKYLSGMRRFAWFLRHQIEDVAGTSVEGFARRHGLSGATLRNYLNQRQFPDLKILILLAEALRRETGEAIGVQTLIGMLDPFGEKQVSAAQALKSYEPLPKPLEILGWFNELSLEERVEIAPQLLRRIALDAELKNCRPSRALAVLIQDELARKHWGINRFAEAYQIPAEILAQAIRAGELLADETPPQVPVATIRKIAENVRDPEGNYGNLPLFCRLFGFPVELRAIICRFSSERGIASTTDLVQYLLDRSGSDSFSEEQKRDLVAALEQAMAQNEIPNQLTPLFQIVLSELAQELGFYSLFELLEVLTQS